MSMSPPIKKGSTDKSVYLRIIDSTDGTPETGVVAATSGLDLWYRREGGSLVSLTESDLAAVNSAHSDGGIMHIGHGVYRVDLPDAAWATGANDVVVCGTVTGMIVEKVTVPLVDYDPQDGVRMGLTALPNAVAGASGGLAIIGGTGININGAIKKNTAFNNYLFYMTDSTTHNYKAGLGSSITCTVIIDGAAPVALTNTPTEIGLGWYKINLTAADTNGNCLGFNFTASGADTTPEAIVTVP